MYIIAAAVDLAVFLAMTRDYENAIHLLTESLLVLRDSNPTSVYTAKGETVLIAMNVEQKDYTL